MSHANGDGHFIGIDWGTTNARALLFAPDGRIVDERDAPLGIKHLGAGGHRVAFAQLIAGWRETHGVIPALLSGMIGSRHGWREVDFVHCPAALPELPRALVPVPDVENAWLVPGLCTAATDSHADVMRGEELQLLGLGERAKDFDWVCIPGTHSKWVRAEWPHVRAFHTAMTGEVFATIAEHTLFAKLIPTTTPDNAPGGRVATSIESAFNERAFTSGLERSAAAHGVLNALFTIRADVLLGRVAPPDIADLLSGLIIGTEIRHMLPRAAGRTRVALLAAPGLQPRYAHALAFFNLSATAFDVKRVTADGFVALMRARSFPESPPPTSHPR